jgi:hypothetical protein
MWAVIALRMSSPAPRDQAVGVDAVRILDRELAGPVGSVEERLDHRHLVLQLLPKHVGIVHVEVEPSAPAVGLHERDRRTPG